MKNFWKRVEKTDTCWLWNGCRNSQGYGKLCRHSNGITVGWLSHRYVWTNQFGEIPEGLCVLHKCDNPPCVNPAHLFLGTRVDNSEDKVSKGRQHIPTGSVNGRAKLEESDVKVIKHLLRLGCQQSQIADWYNVSSGAVYFISNGKNWSHVK